MTRKRNALGVIDFAVSEQIVNVRNEFNDLVEASAHFESEYIHELASCHMGITTMENCSRCGSILRLRKALEAIRKER